MKKLIYVFAIAVMAESCKMPDNNADSPKAEANKARMQKFYDEVINAHSIAAADSFCTADFVDHNPDQGHSGKGIDDLKASFKDFMTGFPDVHEATNFMIAKGDTVMAYITMTGTNSGPMGGMAATNKQMNIEGIDIIVLKDGKAAERWGVFDNMKMMAQLGMMPPPGAAPDSAMAKKDGEKK